MSLGGGFSIFAKRLQDALKLDKHFANILPLNQDYVIDSKLIAEETILNGKSKSDILLQLCKEFDIPKENVNGKCVQKTTFVKTE